MENQDRRNSDTPIGKLVSIGKMAMAILSIGALVIAFGSTQWAKKEDVEKINAQLIQLQVKFDMKMEMQKEMMESQKQTLERIERKIP